MRQYLGSGSSTSPGLYDRFQKYAGTSPLTFDQVFDRAQPPLTSTASPPQSVATELASYIWDLQIRTPTTLQAVPATPEYPAIPPYKSPLPVYLEIRFKALSESAARQLEGNTSVTRTSWNDSNTADPIYQHVILPGTRQFSARAPIYSGSGIAP